VGASVEDLGDGLEALLAGGVPNLHLEDPLINFEEDGPKLDSYGDFMVLLEFISSHPVHQAGLSDRRVPDHDQFEQEILVRDALVREDFVLHLLEVALDLTVLVREQLLVE
jgi:hypothetical protein